MFHHLFFLSLHVALRMMIDSSASHSSVPDHHTGRRRRCNNGGLSQKQQQLEQQPLPRKVRFALHAEVDAEHSTTTAQFTTRLGWDDDGEERRAAVQESALLALGMTKNTADSAGRFAINGQRRRTSCFAGKER